MILVNKADGDLLPAATRTCADYAGALRLLRKRSSDPEGFPKATLVSAITKDGLASAWDEMQALVAWRKGSGHWEANRAEQLQHWFEQEVRIGLLAQLGSDEMRARMARLSVAVAAGEISVAVAAKAALDGQ